MQIGSIIWIIILLNFVKWTLSNGPFFGRKSFYWDDLKRKFTTCFAVIYFSRCVYSYISLSQNGQNKPEEFQVGALNENYENSLLAILMVSFRVEMVMYEADSLFTKKFHYLWILFIVVR